MLQSYLHEYDLILKDSFSFQSPHSHVEYIDLALVLGKECGGKACVAKPGRGARSYKGGCIAASCCSCKVLQAAALHPDFSASAAPPVTPANFFEGGATLLCSHYTPHPTMQCRSVHLTQKYLYILLLSFLILSLLQFTLNIQQNILSLYMQ